mmetsp:Transcript_35765/g.86348  ORF Transcript_35765/g.86348 Transcript_35765/m.86348 type:complete len:90 (+) Transcript_35765:146-415(+)
MGDLSTLSIPTRLLCCVALLFEVAIRKWMKTIFVLLPTTLLFVVFVVVGTMDLPADTCCIAICNAIATLVSINQKLVQYSNNKRNFAIQ